MRNQPQTPQQQHSPQQPVPRPQLSVSVWFLRNTQPLITGVPPIQSTTQTQQQAQQLQPPTVVECAEPGDLLYGCENDLLDTGTKPLTWGPQPSLHHVITPKYFCGEALSALVTVRNTSSRVAAQACRVKVELLESSQRRQVDLLNSTIPTLAANGMAEFRLFTRIIEPGLYSLNAKASSGTEIPATSVVQHSHHFENSQPAVSVHQSFRIECDRGVEEASRKVVQLPSNGTSGGVKPGSSAQRFMVMYGLRNASSINPAALQHVTLVSKDPSVVVVQAHDLNGTDAHMTELLRVPVCTGASAAACEDSVMAAGEVRHFSWIVEYTPSAAAAVAQQQQSGQSTAQAVSMLSQQQQQQKAGAADGQQQQTQQQTQTQFNLGVVEWQWRRAGGDGGAIRCSMIHGIYTSPPASSRAELSVTATGAEPSPCVVGEPCELCYTVVNKAVIGMEINAHVEPSALLPRFVYVGGSTCIPLGNLEPGEEAQLRVPVMPIQSGAFAADAGFTLRDALPPQQPLWSPTARSTNASAIVTNIVCMQAT